MTVPDPSVLPPPPRRVYANRTLNLRAIKAVGCDMDYTLIHYRHELWESRAYEHVVRRMGEAGWPVAGLAFDPEFATRGLILDVELGNLVKATRFGYVMRACHGTRPLSHEEQRRTYSRVTVDLSEPRWVFLNTLFSLSEASLYAQLVDRLDEGAMQRPLGYKDLYEAVRSSVNVAHMEGALKAEIVRDPERFVVLDDELPPAMLDLQHSGKQLLLITNSDWTYTRAMMAFAFDKYLPRGKTWRDLFELIVVDARKPSFFTDAYPILELADEAGLLRPCTGPLRSGGVYFGGNARLIEAHLKLPGEEILYVGDHVYADVHVTKDVLRWRTALVVRELEQEIADAEAFRERRKQLFELMEQKTALEHQSSQLRLQLQRQERGYLPVPTRDPAAIRGELSALRSELEALDRRVAELARQASELGNRRWGPLLRAGNDKSRMARQLERYADIYTSRVSNLGYYTPFAYLRPPPGTLPHDG
ncbi:MAG TPA: HAD-IG family 5'-nucleotidase [Polyangiales bacterium]|nr:HAD-IG family 5'-nucleotidase [Polyangiales bacterium]